jgi:CHAD domain-containing protein
LVCDEAYQRLDDDLKWLSHLFGEARDLDVFREATFFPAAKDTTIPGAEELADYTEAKRNAAHDAVNAAVKSERARRLLVDLVGWIEDGRWRRNGPTKLQNPIEAFARTTLKKRRKKLVNQAADLADLDFPGSPQDSGQGKKASITWSASSKAYRKSPASLKQ